jgi:hypothetical protein
MNVVVREFLESKTRLIITYNKFIYKINLKNKSSIIKNLKANSILQVNIYKSRHNITKVMCWCNGKGIGSIFTG